MDVVKRLPDKYCLGIEKIDLQHSQVIFLLDATMKSLSVVQENKRENALADILRDLNSYARNHLEYEERLMQKIDYPYIDAHKSLHDLFRSKLKELSAYRSMHDKVLREISHFLKEWFLNHICEADMQIAKYLNENPSKRFNRL